MASDRTARRRRPRSAVRRAWLFCFWLSLPGLLFAGILLYQQKISSGAAILIACSLLLYLALIAAALIESLVRPLQTLSNVVASMREGDYSFHGMLSASLPLRSTFLPTCFRNSACVR
jgi:two-component system, NtrC family, nitrogen regulation sensor histidine kinase NtrY